MLMQDWTTIRLATTNTAPVTSPHPLLLDLGESDDVVLFLDVREVSGSMTFEWQTALADDATSFLTYLQFTPTVSPTPRVDRLLSAYSWLPAAKYVRWRIQSAAAFGDITFRVAAARYEGRR